MYKTISLTVAMIGLLFCAAQAQSQQPQPGIDDSVITIEESNGKRTVRRFLHPESKVERVEIVNVTDGKRVTKVHMRNGEVLELPEDSQISVLEESSEAIANATSKSENRGVKEKVNASRRAAAKGTKTVVAKAGNTTRDTAEATVKIGEAAGESTANGVEAIAKGTGTGVKKAADVSATGSGKASEVGKTGARSTRRVASKTREVSTTVIEQTANGSVAVAGGAKTAGGHVVSGCKKVGGFIKGVIN